MRASVLIPVKNGGGLLGQVLDAVLRQVTPWDFEILVVDSGSKDDSIEQATSRGVRVDTIPSASFGHGRTRNLLGSMSRGEFLVYLTQDALPASENWLAALVDGCDVAPNVAGAFGPHIAYDSARYTTKRELEAHFQGFGASATVYQNDDPERYARDLGFRQFLHFFSNNNSCLRRSVWEEIPFPDVNFAEDQSWALRIIEAGYAKAFVPAAAVYHSHDFGPWETFQRNFDESRSFDVYFNYSMQRSLKGAMRSAASLIRRDQRWLREGAQSGTPLNQGWMDTMGMEAGRMLGQYFGTWHRRVPKWAQQIMSRDQRLQAARGK